MVATDQKHFGIQSLVQLSQISLQALGDTEWAMDQIPKNDDALRTPLLTEILQSQQCSPVVITWERDAAGLENLGLA